MNLKALDFILAAGLQAQGATPPPQGDLNSMWRMMGVPVIMMGAFYFMLIRPQQKKAKEHANLLKTLRNGDKIATSAGIIGVVLSVREKHVTMRSAESKFEILKSAVTEVLERDEQGAEKQS